jgi:hypothetical protein
LCVLPRICANPDLLAWIEKERRLLHHLFCVVT